MPFRSELLLAYSGVVLEVSLETDSKLTSLFPDLDLRAEYRLADAWLWQAAKCRRPRNARKFLINWCRKAQRQQNPSERDLRVQSELRVGMGPK